MSKKGQIKLSFGMIFSIILIIIFVAFAFYAIKMFIGLGDDAKSNKFIDDLQSDVDRVWRSPQSNELQEYSLPTKVGFACFVDFDVRRKGTYSYLYDQLYFSYFSNENLVFYPLGSSGIESVNIEHLNLSKMIEVENPFCLENDGGIVKLTLVKDYDESLITITR